MILRLSLFVDDSRIYNQSTLINNELKLWKI